MTDLLELERRAWDVLLETRESVIAFYGEILMEDAVMALPGGLLLDGRDAILEAMDAQRWVSYEMAETRVVRLSDDAGAVVYRASAKDRQGDDYVALMTTVYVQRGGEWRMALHQQTPV